MSFWKDFKEFAIRGNMIDLSVGIVIGASFNKIVDVFVHGILMPPIGLLTGGLNFSDRRLVIRKALLDTNGKVLEPENAIRYGEMVQATIVFLITALAVFLLIRFIHIIRKEHAKKSITKDDAPSGEEKLLMEIRDLLKKGG